jgi:hypothetical protein
MLPDIVLYSGDELKTKVCFLGSRIWRVQVHTNKLGVQLYIFFILPLYSKTVDNILCAFDEIISLVSVFDQTVQSNINKLFKMKAKWIYQYKGALIDKEKSISKVSLEI